MYNYQNNKSKKDTTEIDLLEVVGMLFNHFKMIVIFVLVFSVVGVGVALLQPRKHNITAIVELKTPTDTGSLAKYGIEYYTASKVFSKMFSRESFEAAIPENDKEITYDKLQLGDEAVFSYGNISGTDYYTITARKISEKDSDFYIAIINALVLSAQKDIVATYTESAQEGLVVCADTQTSYMKEMEDMPSTMEASYSSIINSFVSNRLAIEYYISIIPDALTWYQSPVIAEKNEGSSKATICIIFFLVGGVLGALIGIVMDFMDNRIYSSDKLIEFLGDDLVASIPLYKDKNKISKLEYTYIASKLDGRKNILVTSLSEKAGKTTIATGLEGAIEGAAVTDGSTISTTPELLKSAKGNDLVLVVLRAGVDSLIKMDKLISDLKVQGIKYAFVFNCVEKSDKDCHIYSDIEDYEKHVRLKESWKKFYSERYKK